MEDKSLSIAFGDSLVEQLVDGVGEIAEVGIDSVIEEGILKDIPIVSAVINTYKICNGVKDWYTLKKLKTFIDEINRGITTKDELQKYREKFMRNDSFRNREIEHLYILLDRYIGYEKPKMLAKLYIAYLSDEITWKEFGKYSEIIDRFLPDDFLELSKGSQHTIRYDKVSDSLLRLVSLGLMVEHSKGASVDNTCGTLALPDPQEKDYDVSDFGKKLINILRAIKI